MHLCVQVCVPSRYVAGLGHIFWPVRSLGTGCHDIRDQRSYQVSNRKNNGVDHSSINLLCVCVCVFVCVCVCVRDRAQDGINTKHI